MKNKKTFKTKNLCFNRWSRKSYAIFNSIHRVVNIGVLSTACFITLLNTPLSAQDKQPASSAQMQQLDEVTVEDHLPLEIQSQQTRIVALISKEDIQASSATSIDDILEYALNVDIRNRGKNGTQADISIRGGSFDQTMILLNGINITDPQTGHYNLVIPVALDAVDHIEILSGPGAIKWGSNAFSGAINIVTKPEGKTAQVEMEGGQHRFYNTQGVAHVPISSVSNLISVGASGSSGYTTNTDFHNASLFYQGKYATQGGNTEWQVGYTERRYGANGFYTPLYPNQYENEKVTIASIKWQSTGRIKLSPSLYYRGNKSFFKIDRDKEAANHHLSEVFGANIMATYMSKWGLTQVGGTLRNEGIISNVLGFPMNDTLPIAGVNGTGYTKAYNRTNIAWFAEHKVNIDRFYGAITLMLNHNSALPNRWDFFPALEMSYTFNDQWKTYATANKSMRMPTFTDLFYAAPTDIGNPNLVPETAMTYELGTKYNYQNLKSHVAVFLKQGRNLIDWVSDDGSNIFRSVNQTATNTQGIETSASYQFKHAKVNLGYTHLHSSKEDTQVISKYEMAYLKNKLDVGISHVIFSSLHAHWNVSYQDRNGQYKEYQGTTYVGAKNYAPFWLVDLKLVWKKPRYELYVDANNLLNTQYNDVGGIIQPGRWITTGVKIKL